VGLFGRSISKRFPIERWQTLPMMVVGGVGIGANQFGITPEALVATRFFGGYLMGYPTYVSEVDETLGAAVRKLLFTMFFGDQSLQVVRRINELRSINDLQCQLGWGAAVPDGNRYFRAVEDGRDAVDGLDSFLTFCEERLFDVQETIF
jgi:hypothetical protein